MDDRPRNLKAMLSEAKDTSELMVDLGYASLFFGDDDMADEVARARGAPQRARARDARRLRARRPLASATPSRSSGVLHVISAIERMGNAAVDIAKIVTHHLGIPAALVADLAAARGDLAPGAGAGRLARSRGRTLDDVELPTETRHARRRHPAREGLAHRSRRRRDAACPTTCSSCAARAEGSPSCACSRARPSGGRPTLAGRSRRSATSTAPSTCSSR